MSDYERHKVVRLPFPKSILRFYDTDDPWDCEEYLKDELGDLYYDFSRRNEKHFTITCTSGECYLDWQYYKVYGEDIGDYGHVSLLTDKEYAQVKPLFDKLNLPYEREDLRKVDYCYYNGSDAPDYYDIIEEEEILV